MYTGRAIARNRTTKNAQAVWFRMPFRSAWIQTAAPMTASIANATRNWALLRCPTRSACPIDVHVRRLRADAEDFDHDLVVARIVDEPPSEDAGRLDRVTRRQRRLAGVAGPVADRQVPRLQLLPVDGERRGREQEVDGSVARVRDPDAHGELVQVGFGHALGRDGELDAERRSVHGSGDRRLAHARSLLGHRNRAARVNPEGLEGRDVQLALAGGGSPPEPVRNRPVPGPDRVWRPEPERGRMVPEGRPDAEEVRGRLVVQVRVS